MALGTWRQAQGADLSPKLPKPMGCADLNQIQDGFDLDHFGIRGVWKPGWHFVLCHAPWSILEQFFLMWGCASTCWEPQGGIHLVWRSDWMGGWGHITSKWMPGQRVFCSVKRWRWRLFILSVRSFKIVADRCTYVIDIISNYIIREKLTILQYIWDFSVRDTSTFFCMAYKRLKNNIYWQNLLVIFWFVCFSIHIYKILLCKCIYLINSQFSPFTCTMLSNTHTLSHTHRYTPTHTYFWVLYHSSCEHSLVLSISPPWLLSCVIPTFPLVQWL